MYDTIMAMFILNISLWEIFNYPPKKVSTVDCSDFKKYFQ